MRFYIIGCGSIGQRHLRNLVKIGADEITVYDSDQKKYGMLEQIPGVNGVETVEKGLAEQPEGILICTPNHYHLSLARKAINNCKALFIEKPISHTCEGVEKFIKRAKNTNTSVLIGCNMRFHPPIKKMHSWLQNNKIGKLLYGQFRYGNFLPSQRPDQDYRQTYTAKKETGGGVLLDGIHEINYARWFMGEVIDIQALTAKTSDLQLDTEDVAEVLLKFKDGAIGNIHLDYIRKRRGRSCELIGSDGMIVWTATGKNPEHSILELIDEEGHLSEKIEFDADLNKMYVEEMRHFISCVKGKTKPLLNVEEGFKDLELISRARTRAILKED